MIGPILFAIGAFIAGVLLGFWWGWMSGLHKARLHDPWKDSRCPICKGVGSMHMAYCPNAGKLCYRGKVY